MMNLNSIISPENKEYIDLSTATAFQSEITNGCVTTIFTKNGTRTKLSKNLLDDIDNPEYVDVLFTDKNVIFCKSNGNSAFAVKSDGIIYGTALAKKIAELANIEVQTKGSTKAGTYHLQQLDDERIAAVVSFE
jgi:hypothetical protein